MMSIRPGWTLLLKVVKDPFATLSPFWFGILITISIQPVFFVILCILFFALKNIILERDPSTRVTTLTKRLRTAHLGTTCSGGQGGLISKQRGECFGC